MEGYPVNLTGLSILFSSMIDRLEILNLAQADGEAKMKSLDEYLDITCHLKELLLKNAKSEDTKNTIKQIFNNYEEESNLLAKSFLDLPKYSSYGRTLISSILKFLGRKSTGVIIIDTYVTICINVLDDINLSTNFLDAVAKFKTLLEGISSFSKLLKKYWHIIFTENQKKLLMLCLSQMCKCLPFLLKTVEGDIGVLKKYLLGRLQQCFEKIMMVLHDVISPEESGGSEFIILMDSSLYLLDRLSGTYMDKSSLLKEGETSSNSLKNLIDELLCHAMSIAHVTNHENDNKAISAGAQKVLKQFDNLKSSVRGTDVPMIKLNAALVSDALCALEKRVNAAVLQLVLQVFTEINSPLKNMVSKCREDNQKTNKSSDDLELFVAKFDSEMDRIMQIGLFSVSCTSDVKSVLGIKSCLASLESLESELIPCLTALYLDGTRTNKTSFQYLVDHWLKEISELKVLIDTIIDPAAFAEVTESEVENSIRTLKCEVSATFTTNKVKIMISKIVRFSTKLVKTITTSVENEEQKDTDTIKELVVSLQKAIQECEASSKLLDEDEDVNKIVERVIKRCELVLQSITALREHLVQLVQEESLDLYSQNMFEDVSDSDSEITFDVCDRTKLPPQKNYYKICETSDTSGDVDIEVLTPYIEQGKLKTKDRSVMYMTPRKTNANLEQKVVFDTSLLKSKPWDRTPRSAKRSRCCKPLPLKLELGNSLDLEVTSVLESLSQLSTTFNTTICKNSSVEAEKGPKTKDVACGPGKDSENTKPVVISAGCAANFPLDEYEDSNESSDDEVVVSPFRLEYLQSLESLTQSSSLACSKDSNDQYNTPERLGDLKVIERKIEFLKRQMPPSDVL